MNTEVSDQKTLTKYFSIQSKLMIMIVCILKCIIIHILNHNLRVIKLNTYHIEKPKGLSRVNVHYKI